MLVIKILCEVAYVYSIEVNARDKLGKWLVDGVLCLRISFHNKLKKNVHKVVLKF